MKAWTLNKPAPVSQHPLHLSERAVPRRQMTKSCYESLLADLSNGPPCSRGRLAGSSSPVIPGHQIVGSVAALGSSVEGFALGDRVGVAWLNRTCGICEFCVAGRKNLCDEAMFTGWTVDGGYGEYAVAPAAFTYRLPDGFNDLQAAPLLCAGIIGYRCLRLTGIHS